MLGPGPVIGGNLFQRLFPAVADNTYRGVRPGLWLLALMLVKIPMGLNVMLNAPQVARSADGVPVDTFGQAAASAFSFAFAVWGLAQVVLGLLSLVIVLRYRSLASLMFLVLLVEQLGRMALRFYWPVERLSAPGGAINIALTVIMIVGLSLTLLRSRVN